jgi:hypothetical protein
MADISRVAFLDGFFFRAWLDMISAATCTETGGGTC